MHTERSTLGRIHVDQIHLWTLEDPKRDHKVWGETRIPAGRYELKLRTEGGMTQRYKHRFPDMHQGMIWLQDVPFFEWVYIHIGNTPEDTEGCILVGMDRGKDFIGHSRNAYQLLYPAIVHKINSPRGCYLTIRDEEP